MKKISLFILFFVSLIFAKAQNIGIGESNFTPDGSSILEIKSTSKGLLIPRMTKDQRDAIVNPAFGLVIFQIDNNPGIYFNSGTSFVPTWDKIVIEEEITDMHQAVTITGQDYLVLTGQQITAQLINLGAHVTGVLPLTKGGTGATTAADARTNLGLGNSAVLNVGTTAGTVAAGDHAHANYASSSHTHATHTRGTGLTGSNYDGSSATTWAVDFAGSGTATTVSRSDHNHTGTYDNYANWKLQGSGLNESNVTSGTTINITGSGATTVTKSGNTVTISSTDNNSTYTASNGITLNVANFELTGQALALHNLATNGLIVRTGSGTVNGRTITWSGNGGSITNGDGVAGNPSISLSIGTGATQVAAGNHTHDAADVISGEFNRARVRKMTSADTRATNPEPQSYEPALQADFKQNTTDGLSDGGTYHGVISFRPYGSTTDFSGGQMHQMGFTDNGNLWMRKSTGIASWGSWQKLLTSTDIGTISGTQNYISKFTSSNALGNSLLFDNGTSIGIGTATPGATNKLDISYTTGSSGGKGINVSISGNASWSSPDIGLSSSVANSNASLGYGVYGQSTSSSASSGRNWGIYGYAHNGGTNVGTAGYVTSTSGNNAGILGVLNGYESFDVATTMSGSWAGFFSGPVKTTGQFTSSLATGTSPFNVTSTTVNTNLNADLLDGNHASAFQTALTNPVTGTGSSGHVSYWNGATTQTYDSDGNFFWDATNNRLGIGTTGPSYKLDVSGDIRSTGKIYANANGTSYFRGGDDAELWDVNIANTIGIYGVQNSDRATIRLGSGGSDISGLNGNVGIGNLAPSTKLDVNGTTKANAFAQNNSGLRIISPDGGSFVTSTSSITGAIKITLPQYRSSTMMRMTIKIYQYTTDKSYTIELGGYNYVSGSWYNTFANVTSTSGDNLTVRFGYDGTPKNCIWIGELGSTWSYPQVFVTEFQAGYSNYTTDQWDDGWGVSFVSAFNTVENTANSSISASGSGTTNYITKWTPNGTTLGNSLIYDNGTNLSIGTTSPGAKFHISAGDASLALFGPNASWGGKLFVGAAPNQAAANTAQVISTDGNLHIDPAPSKNMYLGYYQARDLFINPNGGNVGIGTTSPGYKLDVNGNIGTNYNSLILNPSGGTVATDGTFGVYWHQSSGTPSSDYGIYRTSGAWTSNTYQQLRLQFATGIQLGAGTGIGAGYDKSYVEIVNGKGLMVSSGNVGIGTTSPSYKLHAYMETSETYGIYSYRPSGNYGGGRASIYGYRYGGSSGSDGTGYGNSGTDAGVEGYTYYGNLYAFGVAGHTYGDFTRTGGTMGANNAGTYWGSLGYKNSASNWYGAYWTGSGNGSGFMANGGILTGIGSGGYGGVMGGWCRGEVLGFTAAGEMYASYNLGNEYTSGVSADIVTVNDERFPAYSVTSNEIKVYNDGIASLQNGYCKVLFDKSFTNLITGDKKPTVTVSPLGECEGIFIASIDKDGFVVKESHGGNSNVEFTWIAVGLRADANSVNKVPDAITDRNFDQNMKDVMFNENNRDKSSKPIWWDGNNLRFDKIPETTAPKPKEETEVNRIQQNINH